ncbi:MAG: ATP synthase F1 subunit delta [Firmicutes bacterium]|nr:ATP synthase F1 subunit delta [Bacillota bacterium]MBQ9972886.1 ATP synthase F1 subunit delta [Bacillota bacterium]
MMKNMSKEFALALFMLAKEEEREHEYFDALRLVADVLTENPLYMDFLSSPRITREERGKALKEAFAGVIPSNVINFLQLMSDEGQADNYYDCVAEYRLMMLQDNQISEAKVTSAVVLTEEEKNQLHDRLVKMSGHPVEMEYMLDENLLGGMIVQIDGKIIDGSLRTKLREMKEVIGK